MYTKEGRDIALEIKQQIFESSFRDTVPVVVAEATYGSNNPILIAEDVLCSLLAKYDIEVSNKPPTPLLSMEVFLTRDINYVYLAPSLSPDQKVAAMLRLVAYYYHGVIRPFGSILQEPLTPKPLSFNGLKKHRADNWVRHVVKTDIECYSSTVNSFGEGLIQAILKTQKITT